MKMTVVALMCHQLANITQPVCREEIVAEQDMSLHACVFSQAAVAEWKGRSIYRGDQWTVQRIKCVPGEYVLKDAI